MAYLWVLNFSDGRHSLLDIAERAAMPFSVIRDAADTLATAGLLEAGSSTSAPGVPSLRPLVPAQ